MKIIIAAVIGAFILTFVESARIKILLEKSNRTSLPKSISRLPDCKRFVPFKGLTPKLKEIAAKRTDAEFFTSDTDKQFLLKLLDEKVKGIDYTAKQFFELLKTKGKCGTYIYGGAVRDTVRNVDRAGIKDIDAETDCNLFDVFKWCKAEFVTNKKVKYSPYDINVCSIKAGYNFALVTFGDHDNNAQAVIDLGSTVETFKGSKDFLEYTPNAVAFDYLDSNVFISLTKGAINDACKSKIGIPVAKDKWNGWAESAGHEKNGKKIFRYWKLKAKKFEPLTPDIEEYTIKKAKEYIKRDNWKPMKSYYCRINYETSKFRKFGDSEGCSVAEEICKASNMDKAKTMKKLFKTDLGWDVPFCGDPKWAVNKE